MRAWPIALTIAFLVVFTMNAVLVYLAITHPDPVVESYQTEAR